MHDFSLYIILHDVGFQLRLVAKLLCGGWGYYTEYEGLYQVNSFLGKLNTASVSILFQCFILVLHYAFNPSHSMPMLSKHSIKPPYIHIYPR